MRNRTPAILTLLVSIVAGVVLGVVFVHAVPTAFAVSAPTSTPSEKPVASPPHAPAIPDPALFTAQGGGARATTPPGPTSTITIDPSSGSVESVSGSAPTAYLEFVDGRTPSKLIEALHALGLAQTAADTYPLPLFLTETDILPSTVHHVLTTGDGSSLWIGRTANTICLMFSSGNPYPTDGIAAGASCQSTTQFEESGDTLQEGVDHWTWNGVKFTTTIEK